MKIQPKVYTFEQGDIVSAKNHDQVAVRTVNRDWKHSNLDHSDARDLTDRTVEHLLEDGTWFYVGNRRELA
jgi:hypothetical protein